jgi:hypothetical protein
VDDIAVLVLASVASLPFAGWVAAQTMAHIERLEMIRHGIVPPPEPVHISSAAALLYLRGALVLGCAAFVLMICAAYLAYPHL